MIKSKLGKKTETERCGVLCCGAVLIRILHASSEEQLQKLLAV